MSLTLRPGGAYVFLPDTFLFFFSFFFLQRFNEYAKWIKGNYKARFHYEIKRIFATYKKRPCIDETCFIRTQMTSNLFMLLIASVWHILFCLTCTFVFDIYYFDWYVTFYLTRIVLYGMYPSVWYTIHHSVWYIFHSVWYAVFCLIRMFLFDVYCVRIFLIYAFLFDTFFFLFDIHRLVWHVPWQEPFHQTNSILLTSIARRKARGVLFNIWHVAGHVLFCLTFTDLFDTYRSVWHVPFCLPYSMLFGSIARRKASCWCRGQPLAAVTATPSHSATSANLTTGFCR